MTELCEIVNLKYMPQKINPFKPNSPSRPGMFVGRIPEIKKIETALVQTKANRCQSFLLMGERGIGKTSLLNYVRYLAEGAITVEGEKLNFLVIDIDLSKDTTQIGLIKKIEIALKRKIAKSEQTKKVFTDIWSFLTKIEAAGIKFSNEKEIDVDIFFEEFSYSLADTINRLTKQGNISAFDASFDGLLILIDESDNASEALDLGTFVKLLTERLQKEGSERLMFGISGLPKTKEILFHSHPSSIRIFEELNLDRLQPDEVKRVLSSVFAESEKLNGHRTLIDEKAENTLIEFSEGFPHFIHQYGYSAFEESDGRTITYDNVIMGAFDKNGALECIGNKYYQADYYNKIKADSYRQVLIIMSEHLDGWVTKKQIKEKFNGTDAILANALKALQDRNIILSKAGSRGTYRLLDKGFAWWIAMIQKKRDV